MNVPVLKVVFHAGALATSLLMTGCGSVKSDPSSTDCPDGQAKDLATDTCPATSEDESSEPYKLPSFLGTKVDDPMNGLYTLDSYKSGDCKDPATLKQLDYADPGSVARVQAVSDPQSETGVSIWVLTCKGPEDDCGQLNQPMNKKNDDGSWDNSGYADIPGGWSGTAEACSVFMNVLTLKKDGLNVQFEERLMEAPGSFIPLAADEGDCAEGSREANLIAKYKSQLTECGSLTQGVLIPKS